MGQKADQHTFSTTHRPGVYGHTQGRGEESFQAQSSPNLPPPLPPRVPPNAPPPYTKIAPSYHSQPLSHSWSDQDPRSSSTQSLVPHNFPEGDGRRTLLLVYIHGFMGNETSFQSFPAHIHNLVTEKLKDDYNVHTKIYPRYKSRNKIEFARDSFCEWLRPHEDPNTNVILLGHSMGGIMSAEVALLGTHRILGIINFDTPFLGMHPGVIASGLGSVFRPTPEAPAQQASQAEGSGLESSASSTIEWSNSTSISQSGDSSTTTLPLSLTSSMDLPTKDPNYDPPFANDVRLAQRSGWLNALHFINKHSDGLRAATQAYVKSHMEFGGVMADYKGLKARYEKIRALEDVEQTKVKRVRFVNYYTASTGRPKKPRLTTSAPEGPQSTSAQLGEHSVQAEVEMQRLDLQAPSVRSPSASPKISVQKPDGEVKALGEDSEDCGSEAAEADQNKRNNRNAMLESRPAMKDMDPSPISCGSQEEVYLSPQGTQFTSTSVADPSEGKAAVAVVSSLPPLPAAPEEPSAFDPKLYTDKDARKVAEKEHIRQVKAYKQSVKDRDKAINERRKLHEKKEKNRAKQDKGEGKKTEKERAKLEKQHSKKSDPGVPLVQNTSAASTDDAAESDIGKAEKPKRDKKFCMLPPTYNGRMDPCWVRVFMPGVDEIGAHCGLFFVDGERYEKFVGDVASTIGKWVEDNGRVSAVS